MLICSHCCTYCQRQWTSKTWAEKRKPETPEKFLFLGWQKEKFEQYFVLTCKVMILNLTKTSMSSLHRLCNIINSADNFRKIFYLRLLLACGSGWKMSCTHWIWGSKWQLFSLTLQMTTLFLAFCVFCVIYVELVCPGGGSDCSDFHRGSNS